MIAITQSLNHCLLGRTVSGLEVLVSTLGYAHPPTGEANRQFRSVLYESTFVEAQPGKGMPNGCVAVNLSREF